MRAANVVDGDVDWKCFSYLYICGYLMLRYFVLRRELAMCVKGVCVKAGFSENAMASRKLCECFS